MTETGAEPTPNEVQLTPSRRRAWAPCSVSSGQLVASEPGGLVAPTMGATSWWLGSAASSTGEGGGELVVTIGARQQLTAHTEITNGAMLVAAPNGTVAHAPPGTDPTELVGLAMAAAEPGQQLAVMMLR